MRCQLQQGTTGLAKNCFPSIDRGFDQLPGHERTTLLHRQESPYTGSACVIIGAFFLLFASCCLGSGHHLVHGRTVAKRVLLELVVHPLVADHHQAAHGQPIARHVASLGHVHGTQRGRGGVRQCLGDVARLLVA